MTGVLFTWADDDTVRMTDAIETDAVPHVGEYVMVWDYGPKYSEQTPEFAEPHHHALHEDTMRATTVWQPWATLIALGVKDKETRGYPPPHKLLGQRIAIHAAKRMVNVATLDPGTVAALEEHGYVWDSDFPMGAVVATAVLADARQVISEFEKQVWTRGIGPANDKNRTKAIDRDPYGDFSVGRWLWCLEDIEPVDPPVLARGYQGWWEWTP